MWYRYLFVVLICIKSSQGQLEYAWQKQIKSFDDANQFCMDNYRNGRLALINSDRSRDQVKILAFRNQGG